MYSNNIAYENEGNKYDNSGFLDEFESESYFGISNEKKMNTNTLTPQNNLNNNNNNDLITNTIINYTKPPQQQQQPPQLRPPPNLQPTMNINHTGIINVNDISPPQQTYTNYDEFVTNLVDLQSATFDVDMISNNNQIGSLSANASAALLGPSIPPMNVNDIQNNMGHLQINSHSNNINLINNNVNIMNNNMNILNNSSTNVNIVNNNNMKIDEYYAEANDVNTLLGYYRKYINKMNILYGTKYLDTLLNSNPSVCAIDCEGTDGKYHPALIQIAINSLNGVNEINHTNKTGKLNCNIVFVMKLSRKIIHHLHTWLLKNTNMLKIVFSGDDDTKIFPNIKNVIDIQLTIKRLWNQKYGVNLAKVYGRECLKGIFLRKNKQLSKSNWFAKKLTWNQIEYAALDSWVTLELYYTLLKRFFSFVPQ